MSLLLLMAFTPGIFAQETARVTGRVTESNSGAPMSAVQV